MTVWIKQKIKDHCDITSSKRIFANEYLTSGVPFYRGREISEKQQSSSEVSELIYISREKFEEIKSKYDVPQKGDLLLTSVGTIGNPYLVKDNEEFYFKDGNLTWFKSFKDLNSKWLYYWLLSPEGKSELNKSTIGSSQKAYTIQLLCKMQFTLPDLEMQDKIANALSSYDELIEKNEKRIKILEEMAQRLYAEWFVNFKFPGHEKVRIANDLPKDWEYKRIDEIAEVIRGTSYSSEQINDDYGDYYLVNLKSFNRGGGFRFDGAKYFNGIVKNNQLLKQRDIVVAVTDMTTDRAVISRPARIPNIKSDKVTFSADVVKIAPEKLPFAYVYYSLLDYRFTETTKNKANGANVLHLKPQAISEYKVLVPTPDLLETFERACGNTVRLTDKLSEENEKLTKMRDLLIPQLMTGKKELKN